MKSLMYRYYGRFLLALMALSMVSSSNGATQEKPKSVSLIFNLDQGMPNGIIENLDLGGLDRALDTVQSFETKYKVYALYSPLTARTDRLKRVLAATARHRMRFILDVYSSDVIAIGNIGTRVRADAIPHEGLAISLKALEQIKRDPLIGPYFAGIRFHEVAAVDFTVKACLDSKSGPNRVDWCDHFQRNLRQRNILQPSKIRPFFEFARRHRMMILWSDWKWDQGTTAQEEQLATLLASGRYSDLLVLQFANNLPGEAARTNDSAWQSWLKRYRPAVGHTVHALGLSDQSWTCANQKSCPSSVIIQWMKRGLEGRATIFSFEPSFYYFLLPEEQHPVGYPNAPQWRSTSGKASPALRLLAKELGVERLD